MAAVEWVGPYRILDSLGAGAMGEVYLAEDPRLRRRVALKTLADSERSTPEAHQALLREARAVARMSHPNVAAVYDVVESDGRVHIVMEYVRGETLAARLGRGALTPGSAVDIGIQLADALAEAHAMGIIHRDLKPSNVIVTPEGSAKVLDFGLARAVAMPLAVDQDASAPDDASDPRLFAGTPPYLPPERFLGRPADTLGDIYSLGVTLFEMLTGQRPYRGRDMSTIGVTALTEPTPRARAINPAVPDALDAIVARAMARNPEDRFGSAVELAHALRSAQRVISEGPTESWHIRGPLLPQILSGSGRRSRWWRPYAWGALALAVLVPFYAISRQARRPGLVRAQPGVVAVLPLLNVSGDPANDPVGVGIADVLITALAQVPGVTMISRSATLPYRERKQDLASIARELGADLVVDGAVQGSGQKIRVTLSLARPGSNEVVWTRAWDGALADILSLQTQAAVALSDALQVTLTPAERRRLERPPTDNTEALGDYVQARAFLDRFDVQANLDLSIGLFESALAKDLRFARARAGLGHAYWRKFERTRDKVWSEKALLETIEALRLDAEDASARETLAIIYAGTGRVEQALEELRRAISFRPKSDEAHALLGQMLFDHGRRDEGIAELKQAIALRPNYSGHYYALGTCYLDAGRYREAAGAFRRVLELQPDSSRGLYMLGTVALASGDTAEAIELLQKAVAIGAGHGAHTNLGHALYTQGRYEDAAKAYEEAARLAPKSPMKHRNLGDVYARLGQPAKAQQAYRRAVELCQNELRTNPRDARALSMMAVYEAKLGQRAEARRHADEAVALAPYMADVVYRRAAALALIGRTAESLAALEEAFARGYSRKLAATDEDLAVLRERQEFGALIGDAVGVPTKGGPNATQPQREGDNTQLQRRGDKSR